ncbi:hypothetical protein SO802_035180 [Lithocarpus litseifolius]|uniref:Vitellogenin n=1 Tax=Lithocarpus litseifolius TaxID=425828 RepID=A0AAW2B9H5_9ROSI
MKVTHILLGRPWLFDQNVKHYGGENTYVLMVGKKEVVLKPMTLAEMDKFKVSKPKVIEGKDLEAKNYDVATEATKTKPDQPIEVPQILADFSKDCTNFSLKDLSMPLCPMHEYSTDSVKGISCLVSKIGDVELKIDASDQGKLEETSEWTVPPLIRDSFSMIGSAVGGTTSAFYGFNHDIRVSFKRGLWLNAEGRFELVCDDQQSRGFI